MARAVPKYSSDLFGLPFQFWVGCEHQGDHACDLGGSCGSAAKSKISARLTVITIGIEIIPETISAIGRGDRQLAKFLYAPPTITLTLIKLLPKAHFHYRQHCLLWSLVQMVWMEVRHCQS